MARGARLPLPEQCGYIPLLESDEAAWHRPDGEHEREREPPPERHGESGAAPAAGGRLAGQLRGEGEAPLACHRAAAGCTHRAKL